jgi:hypothetical protein
VDVLRRLPAAALLGEPFLYPFLEVTNGIAADAKLDEMKGHGLF